MLDFCKNLKTSWNNDFAAYKRAKSNTMKQMDPAETMQNQELNMFLANQNTVTTTLRKQLASVDSFKDIFVFLVGTTHPNKKCFKKRKETKNNNTVRPCAQPPSVAPFPRIPLLKLQILADRIEGHRFVTPDEKFALLRVLVYSITLLDGKDPASKDPKVRSSWKQ